jgi:hypothetical protein
MDHRCLYGHRIPAAFTFAIQNRSCPTCGAPSVTVNGYQAARKLAVEAGLDAVVAFNAVRVLEADWVLSPVAGDNAVGVVASGTALAEQAVAAPPPEEDEVVVEDEPPVAVAPPPEPRITPRVNRAADKAEDARKEASRPRERAGSAGTVGSGTAEPPIVPVARAPAPGRPVASASKDAFDPNDEDFFKGA